MFKLRTEYPWDSCPLDLLADEETMVKVGTGQGCGAGSIACREYCSHYIRAEGIYQYCGKFSNEQRMKQRRKELCNTK